MMKKFNLIFILIILMQYNSQAAPRGGSNFSLFEGVNGNFINVNGISGSFDSLSVSQVINTKNIFVNGLSKFYDITVTDIAKINQLSVSNDATLCNNVSICDNLIVGGTITAGYINSNISFTDLSVAGNGTIDGNLSVGNVATFNNGITLDNNSSLTISGTGSLSVQGQTNLSTLNTTGNTTIGGNLTIQGTFSLPGSFNPNNIDLQNSTATIGNITKETIRFITNPGIGNTFLGIQTGSFNLNNNGTYNTGVGFYSLNAITTIASTNSAFGANSLSNLLTGEGNNAFGSNAGTAYVNAESNNIVIGNNGISGDQNIVRIGTNGSGPNQQNRCFIAGIYGSAIGASNTVIINSNNQLGTLVSSKQFKKNILPISDAEIKKFTQMEPVSFHYKNDPLQSIQYGFIAESVADVFPELVIYDANQQPISIQYHLLYALLHKVITINKKKVDLMEEKILTLQNQLEQLKKHLSQIT